MTGTLILLLLGDGATPPGMRRLALAARWDAWSAPALLGAAVLCGGASAWLHLHLTRPHVAAGQVWAARRRTLAGLTVRIVSGAPGPLVVVVLTPPCDARLAGFVGGHMTLGCRARSVPGWRLIAVPAPEAPVTRIPVTQTPVTQIPVTQTPATETSVADIPMAQTGDRR